MQIAKCLLGCIGFIGFYVPSYSQTGPLTVEKIMRDPKWIGASPSDIYWDPESARLFFNWNPNGAKADSLYYITTTDYHPQKADQKPVVNRQTVRFVAYNASRTSYTYSQNGDIYLVKDKTVRRITQTEDLERDPVFSFQEQKIVFTKDNNLFAWDIASGSFTQLTDFVSERQPEAVAPIQQPLRRGGIETGLSRNKKTENPQQRWIADDALQNSLVLQDRKQKREETDDVQKTYKEKGLRHISLGDNRLQQLSISPDGRYVTYVLQSPAKENKNIIVPDYVTESGYTTDIPGRTKVGQSPDSYRFYLLDLSLDSIIEIKTNDLPGIKDQPDYVKDYPKRKFFDDARPVIIAALSWNNSSKTALVNIYSMDNKDRWLALLDPLTGKLQSIDRQRDEAWIGGPGVLSYGSRGGGSANSWIDENTYWYQSEVSGYSHIYTYNIATKEKVQVTSGKFEVQNVWLSNDHKIFYFISNEVHPGEKQLYKVTVHGGARQRLTTQTGAHEVAISPDEKYIAFLYSYINKPWELYMQENKKGTTAVQLTFKAQSEEFKSYPWRAPEIETFQASDGATVYARVYHPAHKEDSLRPAVVFVHGAGYLQNAHKWWSSYFREYMFNNLLVDNGYTVIDLDYRGSAGYGRDWRTGIYRNMGGKDLSDNVDGVKYLVEKYGVDPKRVGLYGGSYGGFITLMALFKNPGTFAAGAGLRSVVNWANYNHGYTADILNEPFNDSLAYRRSSPIYYAEGLKGHLLMCHGMVDTNVNFQDIIQLTQRLIELGKNNWELAVYPKEDHGFVEASSWTDEYKRIYQLFETQLKK